MEPLSSQLNELETALKFTCYGFIIWQGIIEMRTDESYGMNYVTITD